MSGPITAGITSVARIPDPVIEMSVLPSTVSSVAMPGVVQLTCGVTDVTGLLKSTEKETARAGLLKLRPLG
jgi:hypothetical protein